MNLRQARQLVKAVRRPRSTLRRWEYRRHGFDAVIRRGIELARDGQGYWAYQPLYGLDDENGISVEVARSMSERWEMIEPYLPRAGSALDIGTQHGWFAFKLAERGLYTIGVDRTQRSLRVAQWLALRDENGRAGFLRLDVNPETVLQLPEVDVVLCLSVFHHWVRRQGLDYAAATMRGLAQRCRHQLFFETGQSDEKAEWAGSLTFMGESPRAWIEAFLLSIGFSRITHLGLSPGYKFTGARHLLIADR